MQKSHRPRQAAAALRASSGLPAAFQFRPRTCALMVALACAAPVQAWAACSSAAPGPLPIGTASVNFATLNSACLDLTGPFTVSPGGSLTLGNHTGAPATFNLNDALGGTGPWTITFDDNTTTFVLTKNNTVTGQLTLQVNGGSAGSKLQIGNGGTTGTYNGDIVANTGTSIMFNRSNNLTYGNVISGVGAVEIGGTGTITFSGSNTYSGATTVDAGATLKAGAVNTFSANSDYTVNSTGTLALAGNNQTIGSLAGAGSVTLGSATLTTGNANNTTFSGVIGGSGGSIVKTGTGTFTLTGNNNYTGGTTVKAGILNISANNNLGNGATLSLDGGTLQYGAAFNNLRGFDVTANNGTVDTNGNNVQINNAITGAGVLTKAGSGNLTLGGANTVAGISVNGGKLIVSSDDNLGGAASTLSFNGGTLQTNGALTHTGGGAIGAGGGTIDTSGNNSTLSGNFTGTGALTKIGNGILTLSGDNSGWNGGLNFNAGQITAGSNNGLGAGTFTFNGGSKLNLSTGGLNIGTALAFTSAGTIDTNGNDGTFSGNFTGTGLLTKTGGGVLTLSGDNSGFSGGISLNNAGLGVTTSTALGTGTLTFNSANSRLNINAAGLSINTAMNFANTGRIDNNGNDVTLSGNFTGSSALTLTGGGTTTLSGSNGGYSGNVTIDKGIVTANNSTVFGTGTLAFGNGSANPRLRFGAAGLNIANNIDTTNNDATILTGGNDGTLSGVISGANGLTKNLAGNLILTGTNTYTGNTTVNGGTLSVNGSIATSAMTTITSGGTLGGTGRTGAVTVNSGGTLAPGNSIGTLNTGPLTFNAGSTYRVEVDAAGNGDRTNVNGALTINGGTVSVQAATGNYVRNTSYTILSSTGATTGTFSGVTSNLVFLTPTLTYLSNGVQLLLTSQNALNYGAVAATPNQGAVAGALQSIINAGGSPLTVQIDNLTAGQAQTAFNSLSGAQFAAGSNAGLNASKGFGDGVNSHVGSAGGDGSFNGIGAIKGSALAFSSPVTPWGMGGDMPYQLAGMMSPGANAMASSAFSTNAVNNYYGETGRAASGDGIPLNPAPWAPNAAGQNGLWGQAMGTVGRMQSNGNGAGSSYGGGGFMVGVDRALNANWLVGAAGGYSRTRWNASMNGTSPATGTVDTPQGALYARYTQGPWMMSLSGGYADHKFDATRSVVIGPVTNNATSSHRGNEWSLDGQVEYAVSYGSWQLRPLAGVRYSNLREDSFTETGAGLANLSVNARTTESTTVSGGLRALKPFADKSGGFEAKVVYSHLFGNNDSPVSARLAGQSAVFTASGTPLRRDALTLSAGFGKEIRRNLSGFVEVKTEQRGSGQEAYAISGGLRWLW